MMDSKELTWQATAAANILEARLRNGRRITRKSRAGCKTCKARHVKCDQSRPICQRCVNSGKECLGYDDISPPPSKKNHNNLLGIRLSQDLGLKENDRRTFDYFLTWAAPRLAGSLDKDFWCGQVLQIAHTEPMIRDALLSISLLFEHPQFQLSFHNRTTASAHEDLMPGSWLQSDKRSLGSDSSSDVSPTVNKPKIDQFHALALQYYNRSIQGFKNRMAAGEATPLLALLSCVLFVCIETMRDNAFSALALFKSGSALLRYDFAPNKRTVFLTNGRKIGWTGLGPDGSLLHNLRQRMGRLSLLAALSGHPENFDDEDSPAAQPIHVFASLTDARDALFRIMCDVHTFVRDAEYRADLQHKVTRTDSPNDAEAWSFSTEMTHGNISMPISPKEEPTDGITRLYYGCHDAATPETGYAASESVHPTFLPHVGNPTLLIRQEELKTQLLHWYEAFMQMPEKSNEAACSLLLHFYAFYVWMSVRLDPLETGYDQYTAEFEQILSLAERYIELKPERQTFSFESQVLAPLYFAATKCRVPSFRRRAIDLIRRSPKKECTFGALSTAEIALRLIAIEEIDLFPQGDGVLSSSFDDDILPPDSARIRGFEIIVNRPLGIHELRVTRYARRDDGVWIKSIADFPL